MWLADPKTLMMASFNCDTMLWCCGNLQTGAITVGVADLVFIILLLGHYLEMTWEEPFGLGLVAYCLVILFLFASSCLMLHGVLKKQRLLLLPWMVLHLGATVGALIYCGIEFGNMKSLRALLILGATVQIYFFLVVLRHYVELGTLNDWPAVREQPEGEDLPDLGEYRKNNCLIDLELEEKPDSSRSSNHDLSFAKDDTFTQLAATRQGNGRMIGDGGDLVVASSSSTGKVDMKLPTPDEVIQIPTKEEPSVAIPRRSTTWKSSATLEEEKVASQDQAALALLPQAAKSESKILLGHVDNNFSPFRSKSAAQNGPKMKVFLPTRSSDEEEELSSSEDDKSKE